MANTIKAELWDKMQYLFRNYYDRMIHCVLYYDAPIDIEALKQVLIWTTEKVPVLHSSFHGHVIEPYWKVENYKIEDILTVNLNSVDLDADIDKFVTKEIPINNNVQYRLAVISDGTKWSISVIANHMCMDGGDFKYFMQKLAENYQKKINGERGFVMKNGSRSFDSVYTKLNDEETKIAKRLFKNISAVKDDHHFPLTPDSPIDRCMIIKRMISAELFDECRRVGKTMSVTVNDLMLTFYIRALYEIGNFCDDESLAIPCMVDLRRYIKDTDSTGLTNHTGFMICNVAKRGDTINDTLVEVLHSLRKSKDDPYMGLYSLPLLKFAYAAFPYMISEKAIKAGYLNPLIGMSNIGILDDKSFKMGDSNVIGGWLTGGIKFKPYMQLAMTTMFGEVTMTVAIRGNDKDKEIVENFFDLLLNNMKLFIDTNKHRLEATK